MEQAKAKQLRKRLDTKLIKLIAPNGMSIDEYKISCNLESIDPTVENGQFLHWVMTSTSDDNELVEKVHNAIINALEKSYLLDLSNAEQCEYFCDAIHELLLNEDKDFITRLLEAILRNYKDSNGYGSKVYEYCRSLNKAFGFTLVGYFIGGEL